MIVMIQEWRERGEPSRGPVDVVVFYDRGQKRKREKSVWSRYTHSTDMRRRPATVARISTHTQIHHPDSAADDTAALTLHTHSKPPV